MNKLLILFKAHDISSKTDYHNDLYNKLIQNHIKNIDQFDNIKTFFLFANPDLNEDELVVNNSIYFKMNENYHEALLYKIIKGMYFFIKNSEYTHLFTANLSTCVNAKRILKMCDENLVKSKVGFFDKNSLENHFNKKVDYNGSGYNFPSGAGCLYTKKAVKLILDRFENIKNNENFIEQYPQADDVFIGKVLHEISIKIQEIDRIEIEHPNFLNLYNIDKNTSHVRVKYSTNRKDEILAHEKIYSMFS